MLVYLWTAVTPEAASLRRSFGISDDASRARDAAGQCLRDGHAQLAVVETARTEIHPHTFLRRYRLTGTGWWATPGLAGQVRWTRFTSPDTAPRLHAPAAGEADRDA